MSQNSESWQIPSGNHGDWRKCPKYDIIVNGCSKYFKCQSCIAATQGTNTLPTANTAHTNLYKPVEMVRMALVQSTFGGY